MATKTGSAKSGHGGQLVREGNDVPEVSQVEEGAISDDDSSDETDNDLETFMHYVTQQHVVDAIKDWRASTDSLARERIGLEKKRLEADVAARELELASAKDGAKWRLIAAATCAVVVGVLGGCHILSPEGAGVILSGIVGAIVTQERRSR